MSGFLAMYGAGVAMLLISANFCARHRSPAERFAAKLSAGIAVFCIALSPFFGPGLFR